MSSCQEAGGPSSSKKVKMAHNLTSIYTGNDDLILKMSQAWRNKCSFKDENVEVDHEPFRYVQMKNLLVEEFLEKLYENFDETKANLVNKVSDLFQFTQSDDLTKMDHMTFLKDLFTEKLYPIVKNITGLPLNDGEVDMFFSIYEKTDFLLCHDDELDSRRIAFILYLNMNEWEKDFGGTLDFYDSNDECFPTVIKKQLCPELNKFVFFEVSQKSFHQVAEVLHDGDKRLALSGWFYGTPLPRPEIKIPHEAKIKISEFMISNSNDNKDLEFKDEYMKEENQQTINEQLMNESYILMSEFLSQKSYKVLYDNIIKMKDNWINVGPANLKSYKILPSSESATLFPYFQSSEFIKFIESVTEYDLKESEVTHSLRKYSHKDYELLKSTSNSTIQNDSSSSNDGNIEDQQIIDIIYFLGEWDDEFGGLSNYFDEEGEQLISVTPTENSLAIIVRDPSVKSCVTYINCDSDDLSFYAFVATFSLKTPPEDL